MPKVKRRPTLQDCCLTGVGGIVLCAVACAGAHSPPMVPVPENTVTGSGGSVAAPPQRQPDASVAQGQIGD
jgi:hypothetical protein